MYAYTSDQYLHVLQVLDHWGTETTTESPKHLLVTPHPGGAIQGTPGHVPNHFLTPSQSPPRPDFFFSIFPTFLCCGASCHGSRISQDRPGTLKLGPIALPRALYRVHSSVLKLKGYFHCSGAPKMALLLNFQYIVIWWRMDKNCNKPAKFVCH